MTVAELRIGILTCSDTRTPETDTAGAALRALSEERGWVVSAYRVVADDRATIAATLVEFCSDADVIITCGGTGLSLRDQCPEATRDVSDREVPGIAEYLRAQSFLVTKRAMLSRATAGQRGTTLIVNFPGSEKAARESFGFVADQFEHGVEMMAGGGH